MLAAAGGATTPLGRLDGRYFLGVAWRHRRIRQQRRGVDDQQRSPAHGESCFAVPCLGILLTNDAAPNRDLPPAKDDRRAPKDNDVPVAQPKRLARSEIVGGAFDKVFEDKGPEGAVLIGFEIGLGKFANLDVVQAVQPIYRTPQREVRGRKFGTDFSRPVLITAKPGYAVGAIDTRAGLIVNGFSATFMRIKGADLDPADSYPSPWVGDTTGGRRRVLAGEGSLIIGIIGKHNDKNCTGIGLLRGG